MTAEVQTLPYQELIVGVSPNEIVFPGGTKVTYSPEGNTIVTSAIEGLEGIMFARWPDGGYVEINPPKERPAIYFAKNGQTNLHDLTNCGLISLPATYDNLP